MPGNCVVSRRQRFAIGPVRSEQSSPARSVILALVGPYPVCRPHTSKRHQGCSIPVIYVQAEPGGGGIPSLLPGLNAVAFRGILHGSTDFFINAVTYLFKFQCMLACAYLPSPSHF